MEFSLDHHTARLSVGELADFQIGPRESSDGGPQGIWRAQLGTHWHQQLRSQLESEQKSAVFEVQLTAEVMHHGWRVALTGRIDQLIPPNAATDVPRGAVPAAVLREVKTVLRPLPAAEEELRNEYPSYFAQLATYLALSRLAAPIHPCLTATTPVHGELVFVEAGSGLVQTLRATAADEQSFWVQLERLLEFLNQRLRARERLRNLHFHPAFPSLRPGQESIQADLRAASAEHPIVFLEAPTGFGKTGALLEFALTGMREGRYERTLYLTSKATGQLQVARQLENMTQPPALGTAPLTPSSRQLAIWHVRNKREHCVNDTYHCVRDVCRYLHDVPQRWQKHGLSRFFLIEQQDRSMDAVRTAGNAAGVCPYEITRTSLAFNDVWIGDYNYVFSPSSRGLFFDQPGFEPPRTLLVVDEAHNLPSRVADAYSHHFDATEATLVGESLAHTRSFAPLVTAWSHWAHFLQHLKPAESLNPADEDDARHLLETIAKHVGSVGLDYAELGATAAEALWQIPPLLNELEMDLPRLWWSPRAGELAITCLDAAKVIGPALRSFGGVVLASATLSPTEAFAAACGLQENAEAPSLTLAEAPPEKLGKLTKRDTKKLFANVSRGTDLLTVHEQRTTDAPGLVRAHTPWRDQAYDVAVDLRVDTSYQQRVRHHGTTASTIEALSAAAHFSVQNKTLTETTATACVAVFFPSYLYADAIQKQLVSSGSTLRVAMQPRLQELAAQHAWVEESLALADAIFLVLGSSFAEGIDLLGGRVTHAMVVGPALPEVNAVQKARVAAFAKLGREAAFRRVYQIPGIQKVNQALGRLVRAPGQHAKVLLHCRRFVEPAYAQLLAPEYQMGEHVTSQEDLANWLAM